MGYHSRGEPQVNISLIETLKIGLGAKNIELRLVGIKLKTPSEAPVSDRQGTSLESAKTWEQLSDAGALL